MTILSFTKLTIETGLLSFAKLLLVVNLLTIGISLADFQVLIHCIQFEIFSCRVLNLIAVMWQIYRFKIIKPFFVNQIHLKD